MFAIRGGGIYSVDRLIGKERSDSQLDHTSERGVDLAFSAGIQYLDLLPAGACGLVDVFCICFCTWIGRVHDDADHRGFRNQLVQKLLTPNSTRCPRKAFTKPVLAHQPLPAAICEAVGRPTMRS